MGEAGEARAGLAVRGMDWRGAAFLGRRILSEELNT